MIFYRIMLCQGLSENDCQLPNCQWVNKKRKYCRSIKNKVIHKSKSNDKVFIKTQKNQNKNIKNINCSGLNIQECLPPDCKWVNKQRKYCRSSKNIYINKNNQQKLILKTPINEKIIKELSVLRDNEKIKGIFYKVKAYNIAINAIKNDFKNIPITSGSMLKDYKGVGTKIINKIDEIINTGELQSANIIKKEQGLNDLIIELSNIHGIGNKKAIELVTKKNIKSLQELRERQDEIQENNRPLLNNVQKKGLKYMNDLLRRIPRKEMDLHNKFIQTVNIKINELYPGTQITMVGSYRRNKPDSGDIDLLITNDKNNKEVFELLIKILKQNYITETLSLGSKKFMGICDLGKGNNRRLDILYTSKEEYPFALLYFTGSSNFNTTMRDYANSIGYRLNEYNLKHYDITNKKVGKIVNHTFNSESDIFNYLNIPYIEPENREAKVLEKMIE